MDTNPSKIIRYDLLVVLIGVACSLAAERFVHPPGQVSAPGDVLALRLSTAAFLLTSLNFLHGKTVTLDDENYNRVLVNRPGLALADFALNVLIVLVFVFMSLYLDKPTVTLTLNILLRLVDIPLTLLVGLTSIEPITKRAQSSWFWIDIAVILIFLAGLLIPQARGSPVIIAVLFATTILFDIGVDYRTNYHLYFSSSGSWQDMTDVWDAAQGDIGDIYRRRIVAPALSAAAPFVGSTVLDLGCGNGCISRQAVRFGASRVTAIDRFEGMLERARLYPDKCISYFQADIEEPLKVLKNEMFDVVVCCFSLQDCGGMREPLRTITRHLKDSGRILIVYENERAFADPASHTTTSRIPLDGPRTSGRGQRWLLSWNPNYILLGQADTLPDLVNRVAQAVAGPETRPLATVTRFWDTIHYLREATHAGLTLNAWPETLRVNGAVDSSMLDRYERNPRFSLISLRRGAKSTVNASATIPLLLIAGVSGTGKTRLASDLQRRIKGAIVVNLDNFFLSKDDRRLFLKRGKPDWESQRNVDMERAAHFVADLVNGRPSNFPRYNMAHSRIDSEATLDPAGASIIIVEGLFAFDLFIPEVEPIMRLLIRASAQILPRIVIRDIKEGRRSLGSALLQAMRVLIRVRQIEGEYSPIATHRVGCNAPFDHVQSIIEKVGVKIAL